MQNHRKYLSTNIYKQSKHKYTQKLKKEQNVYPKNTIHYYHVKTNRNSGKGKKIKKKLKTKRTVRITQTLTKRQNYTHSET